MMELIIQESKKEKKERKKKKHNKKQQVQEPQKVQSINKSLELFLRCPILILAFNWKL
jgi:hypothetical protein